MSGGRKGPFWTAYKAVYWTFAVGLGLSVSLSVTLRTCSGPAEDGVTQGPTLSDEECRSAFSKQLVALRASAQAAVGDPALDADSWSGTWKDEMKALRAQCGVRRGSDESPLRSIADDLERLHLAWTTAFKGYAEVGLAPSKRLVEALEP